MHICLHRKGVSVILKNPKWTACLERKASPDIIILREQETRVRLEGVEYKIGERLGEKNPQCKVHREKKSLALLSDFRTTLFSSIIQSIPSKGLILVHTFKEIPQTISSMESTIYSNIVNHFIFIFA